MVIVDTSNLTLIKDEQANADGEQAIIDHPKMPDGRVRPATYSGSSRQYLDVDDVLARSLPVCQANTVPPFRKWIFPWRRRSRLTASQAIGNREEVEAPDSPKVA